MFLTGRDLAPSLVWKDHHTLELLSTHGHSNPYYQAHIEKGSSIAEFLEGTQTEKSLTARKQHVHMPCLKWVSALWEITCPFQRPTPWWLPPGQQQGGEAIPRRHICLQWQWERGRQMSYQPLKDKNERERRSKPRWGCLSGLPHPCQMSAASTASNYKCDR